MYFKTALCTCCEPGSRLPLSLPVWCNALELETRGVLGGWKKSESRSLGQISTGVHRGPRPSVGHCDVVTFEWNRRKFRLRIWSAEVQWPARIVVTCQTFHWKRTGVDCYCLLCSINLTGRTKWNTDVSVACTIVVGVLLKKGKCERPRTTKRTVSPFTIYGAMSSYYLAGASNKYLFIHAVTGWYNI